MFARLDPLGESQLLCNNSDYSKRGGRLSAQYTCKHIIIVIATGIIAFAAIL